MRILLPLLILLSVSLNCFARGGHDDPTPFPLGQAPADFVGQWNNPQRNETIVITHLPARKNLEDRLYVVVFEGNIKRSNGTLYFNETRFCGVMHKTSGGDYNLCVWKLNGSLQTATFTDGGWGQIRRYEESQE
jgi:hypothetical protein